MTENIAHGDDISLVERAKRISEIMKSNLLSDLDRRVVAQRSNGETTISYSGVKQHEDDTWFYLGNVVDKEYGSAMRLPKKDYSLTYSRGNSGWEVDSCYWEQVIAGDSLVKGDFAKVISLFNGVVRVVSGTVVGTTGNDYIDTIRFSGKQYDETVQTYFPHTLCYTYRQKTPSVA